MDWTNWFDYDPTSPSGLRWRVARLGGPVGNVVLVAAGDVAGSKDKRGRWSVSLNDRNHLAHRVVYEIFNGPLGRVQVDHKDGNTSNNLIGNLRPATSTINNRNRARSSRNTSGKTGVSESCGAFKASWLEGTKRVFKSFSVAKFGREEALKLATSARSEAIDRLNKDGAGYSERHGK